MSARLRHPSTTALAAVALALVAVTITPLVPEIGAEGGEFDEAQGAPAYAGVFAVWFEFDPLIARHPALACVVLAAAAACAAWACVRVARAPAGTPPAGSPALAVAGLGIALTPWLPYASMGFATWEHLVDTWGFGIVGWMQLGALGWVLVAAGLVVAVGAGRARTPRGLVAAPLVAAAVLIAGWGLPGMDSSFSVQPNPVLLVVAAALATAVVLPWREARVRVRAADDRGLVRAGCLALAATPLLPWEGYWSVDWWLEERTPWLFAVAAAIVGALGRRGAPRGPVRLLAAGAVPALVTVAVVLGVEGRPALPAPYVAAGAAALVCAVLLRPQEVGGTL